MKKKPGSLVFPEKKTTNPYRTVAPLLYTYYLRIERGSVDTDMVVCAMSIPTSLSRLKK